MTSSLDFTQVRERGGGGSEGEKGAFAKVNTSFFHGAYKKYVASLGKKSYILKVSQEEYPELPVVEAISNRIARVLDIPVPEFHFIRFQNVSDTFLSRNILDDHPHAILHHIYKYLDKGDAHFTCENLVNTIRERTNGFQDVGHFVRLCLFDALIGNHDRHGRNIALVEKGGKKLALAPFYDNPSYLGVADVSILSADLCPRGKIATSQTDEPTAGDYLKEFERLGMTNIAHSFRDKVIEQFATILNIVKSERNLSKERKRAFAVLLEKRLNEYENS